MDKSYQSSADSTNSTTITTSAAPSNSNTSTTTTTNHCLRQLNKLSQKISKPIIKKSTLDPSSQNHQPPPSQNQTFNNHSQFQPAPPPPPQPQTQQNNLQHQPPVYNINKNDFRDVVQKLTGSPAHERISTPPPIQQPKPPSSRLQRIRPPPLAQISNRPQPPLLNATMPRSQLPPPPTNPINALNVSNSFAGFGRPVAPLSPLPPFPTVHAAAESPVSAYMRYFQNSMNNIDSNSKQFSGFSPLAPLVSPRWNSFAPQQPQTQTQPQPQQEQQLQPQPPQQQVQSSQQVAVPPQAPPAVPSQSQFQMPNSPVPFGCLNSPLSSYPLLSPGLLFSPNSGQLGFPQLPLSPTVPVPSPTWRGL